MTTFALDIALQVALGGSLVWASRHIIAYETWWRSAALGALCVINLLLFMPVGAYLMWRYPEWSLMYLAESGDLGTPDAWLVVFYPLVGIISVLVARTLIARGKKWGALAITGAGLALAGAIAFLGQRQLLTVGTTEAFRADTSGLRPLFDTPLIWILGAATLVIGTAWLVALWRLRLLGKSWLSEEGVEEEYEYYEEYDSNPPPPEPTVKRAR